jgi:N-acetylmuramoyl-L-alanine amidase
MRKFRTPIAALGVLFCTVCLWSILSIPTLAASSAIPISLDNGQSISGELIDSVTYIPLRRFCDAMGGATIEWNARTSTATVTEPSRGLHMTVKQGAKYIEANGRYFYAPTGIRNVGGSLYVPIRPLAKAYSLEVTWSDATRSVALRSTGKKLVSGDSFYKSDEVYWLSRIIHAESGAEPFDGKIAVGNVVLNRVESKQYPNTIYGVIFDRRYGTQFSPVSYGTIYNTPSAESVIAAKICLEGYTLSEDILFFMNPRLSTTNWIAENRPYAFTIGRHDFYY